jgi:molecular chaperone HscB
VYLLRLQGIDALDANNTKMAPAFLMQQMEWREAIEDARAEKGDVGKSIAVLDRLTQDLRLAHRRIETHLADLIDSAHDFSAASEAVRQLRFMDKLIAEVGDVYEELET